MNWEYKTIKIAVPHFEQSLEELFEIDIALNQFGSDGWELVSSFDTNEFHGKSKEIILIFKRPLAE
jgi:Domain of unknown function (DUF4177)